MSEQTIDKLQIEIESKVNVSLDAFNKLSSSLNNLKKTIESSSKGFNSLSSMINRLNSGAIGNLKAMVASLNSISSLGSLKLNIGNMPSSIERLNNSLSGASVANFSKIPALANGLKNLSSVPDIKIKLGNTISSIERLDIALAEANAANFNKLQTLAKALLSLSTVPAINLKFGTLAKNLNNLNSVLGVFDTRNVSKLYTLSRALSMMGSIPPINLKIGNLGTQINKLSTALAGISADSNKKIRDLASALTSLTTLPKMSLSLTSFIKSLDKLGSIDITKLATDIKNIDVSIRPLIQSLSSVSGVSSTLGSLTSQLNKLSTVSTSGMNNSKSKGFNSFLDLGKITAAFFAVKNLTSGIGSSIENINDYVEDINLFSVAMGEFAHEGEKFANNIQKALGIDAGEAMRYMGIFQQITTSMGLTSDKAYVLSKNFTQLGYDLASFYNVSTEASFEKLQAGITGQVQPLRQLGIDITNTRLQQELYNLGIDESIRNLGQMDKVQLRYIAIMKQTINAQGDMAKTIITPANALRVLQAQFRIASREIGSIFIPILLKIIPPVIAVIKTIGSLAKSFANLLGFKMPTIDYSGLDGLGNINSGLEDMENGLDNVGDEAEKTKKELKAMIGGFDELNILQEKSANSDKADKPSIGAGGILGDIELPEYDMLSGGISKEIDSLAESFKKLIDAFTENPVITAIAEVFKFLWEKAIKPLGEWILANPDEFADFIIAIGLAIATYELVTLLEKIGTAITKSGGLLGALQGLFPILTKPWALAIAMVAGAIAFLALALYRADKDAKDADLAKRFGNITLSLEEMRAIAEEMLNTETMKKLTEAFKEFDKLDSIKANIDTAVETLNKLNWKVGVGLTLNEQEQEDYKSAIDSYVTNAQAYVEQRHYALTILMEATVGVDNPSYETIMKSVNEISASMQSSMKTLGDQLRDTTNKAFADGLLTIDEAKEITEIQQQMQDMLNIISKSEYEAKIDIIKLRYGGGKNLTVETFNLMNQEIQKVNEEFSFKVDEGIELGLKELRINVNYAEAELAKDPTNEDKKRMLDNAIIAYDEYFKNNNRDITMGELNGITTGFTTDTISEAFKEEIDKLTPELSSYTVLSVNEAFSSASEEGVFNLSKFVSTIEQDLKTEFDGMAPGAQEAIKNWLKQIEPTNEDNLARRKRLVEQGKEIPADISKGITDVAMLKALAGDTTGIYELIGNTLGNSPEKTKIFEDLKSTGYEIPQEIIAGMETKNPDLIKAGNDISSGVFQGTKEQFEKDKTNWLDVFTSVITWFKDLFGIHSPSTVFDGFGLNIVEGLLNGLKEKWKDLLSWWNEGIGSWWKDDIAPWFTIEQWRKLGDGIKDSITEKFDAMKTWWNTNITSWWNDNVIPWFTLDKWQGIGDGIKEGISEKFDAMKTSFNTNISSWWENDVKPWFTISKWADLASGVKTGLEQAFKDAMNGAIENLNSGIRNINSMLNFEWDSVKIAGKEIIPSGNIKLGKLPTIPKLAKGGVLYEDSVVNVAEYSNAKSNPEIVAPQDIMYETVVDANAELAVAFYEVGKMIIEAINNKDSDIVIDGETITKKVVSVINNTTKRTGRTPLLVT